MIFMTCSNFDMSNNGCMILDDDIFRCMLPNYLMILDLWFYGFVWKIVYPKIHWIIIMFPINIAMPIGVFPIV